MATSGRVFVGDADLNMLGDKPLTRIRRDQIGFVLQAFNLGQDNWVAATRKALRDKGGVAAG